APVRGRQERRHLSLDRGCEGRGGQQRLVQVVLFNVGHQVHVNREQGGRGRVGVGAEGTGGRRQLTINIVAGVRRRAHLLEVVHGLGAGGRFTDLLHRRDQQGDEDRDDSDHDQQFDQGEAASLLKHRQPFLKREKEKNNGRRSRLPSPRWDPSHELLFTSNER